VVYLEKAEAAPPPATHLKIEQRNTRFVPESVVAVVGQTIDFPNLDKFYHNVFSVTPGNEFDLGLYRSGVSKGAQLNQPGELTIYCNIHPEMVAQVLVLQNAHYAEVAADGSYTLADVPPGSYTLVAWSAKHEPQKQAIEVKAGATAKASFTMKLRKAGSHLNKNGEQYGRYK
jgi:plastocyanin